MGTRHQLDGRIPEAQRQIACRQISGKRRLGELYCELRQRSFRQVTYRTSNRSRAQLLMCPRRENSLGGVTRDDFVHGVEQCCFELCVLKVVTLSPIANVV